MIAKSDKKNRGISFCRNLCPLKTGRGGGLLVHTLHFTKGSCAMKNKVVLLLSYAPRDYYGLVSFSGSMSSHITCVPQYPFLHPFSFIISSNCSLSLVFLPVPDFAISSLVKNNTCIILHLL